MYHWIYSNNRKVHQRRMNKVMRLMNKNIENDSLWRGRFVVRQDSAHWIRYEDNSGHELVVVLKFIDKKTGKTILCRNTVNQWCHISGWRVWETMNNFIVEDCDVWRTEGREALVNDKTDWSKVKV